VGQIGPGSRCGGKPLGTGPGARSRDVGPPAPGAPFSSIASYVTLWLGPSGFTCGRPLAVALLGTRAPKRRRASRWAGNSKESEGFYLPIAWTPLAGPWSNNRARRGTPPFRGRGVALRGPGSPNNVGGVRLHFRRTEGNPLVFPGRAGPVCSHHQVAVHHGALCGSGFLPHGVAPAGG